MAAVRYVALASLVVWLGVLQSALTGNPTAYASTIAFACGGALIISLFAMKFLGPPPRSFVPRVALVAAMLALTAARRWWHAPDVVTFVNTVCGFVLLSWYARE